jgi:hypothetical protein
MSSYHHINRSVAPWPIRDERKREFRRSRRLRLAAKHAFLSQI